MYFDYLFGLRLCFGSVFFPMHWFCGLLVVVEYIVIVRMLFVCLIVLLACCTLVLCLYGMICGGVVLYFVCVYVLLFNYVL